MPRIRLLLLITLALHIHQHLARFIRPHQRVEHLLARPQALRLEDRRGRDVDVEVRVGEVGADLGELGPGEEAVFLGEEEGGGDEVLDGGDDGFAVAWGDEVELDVH